eukprot:gene4754-4926_t
MRRPPPRGGPAAGTTDRWLAARLKCSPGSPIECHALPTRPTPAGCRAAASTYRTQPEDEPPTPKRTRRQPQQDAVDVPPGGTSEPAPDPVNEPDALESFDNHSVSTEGPGEEDGIPDGDTDEEEEEEEVDDVVVEVANMGDRDLGEGDPEREDGDWADQVLEPDRCLLETVQPSPSSSSPVGRPITGCGGTCDLCGIEATPLQTVPQNDEFSSVLMP